ncbi:MAG: zinc/iron permease [Fibrobacteres bacterium]|nr:zinc/iron permease [Fibrobacterota bacterium]
MDSNALWAGLWGLVGGASLLLGAVAGLYFGAGQRMVAILMAGGSGVLVSSAAFELMEGSFRKGGIDASAVGPVLGSLVFFGADAMVNRNGGKHRKRSQGQQSSQSGLVLAIGASASSFPGNALFPPRP